MIATIEHNGEVFRIDLNSPLDISIPMRSGKNNLSAWYVDPIRIEPVMENGFVGSVQLGGDVNFKNIFFNPHGHGTHTECVGHISRDFNSVNKSMSSFVFTARLISIEPSTSENGDRVITGAQMRSALTDLQDKAVVIRTLPNDDSKKTLNYSGTNPAYLSIEAMQVIVDADVDHLLLDLPSVDREIDGGELAAHHLFWNYPTQPSTSRTITELIYANDTISDGRYILDLHFPPFENDASPSRPLLFKLL